MTIRLFSKGQKDLTEEYLKHLHCGINFYLSGREVDSDGMQSAGVTNFFRFFKTIEIQGQVYKNKMISSISRIVSIVNK